MKPSATLDDIPQQVAVIDEDHCIGCALCIKACPVDAIVGAHTFMHTVIANECIGCKLCVPPCPVDCITMIVAHPWKTARERAQFTRTRHRRRKQRLASHTQQYADATRRRREELKVVVKEKTSGHKLARARESGNPSLK